jgi:hypothetical protein
MITYEDRLNSNLRWAFLEGSLHFERKNEVHKTLQRIVQLLDELKIPYAILGSLAMFFHGYRRFTEDIDILLTSESLHKLHAHLEEAHEAAPFTGTKKLRDVLSGVGINFLVSGEFPGDRTPKPVAFPDPVGATIEIAGMRFLQLPRLVELKLASGMTAPWRLQDLADAEQLIRVLHLSRELAEELHPFVAEKYRELWDMLARHPEELC